MTCPSNHTKILDFFHLPCTDFFCQLGDWLSVNGEAIYRSKPWATCQNESDSNVYYTANRDRKTLYVHITKWPQNNLLQLYCPAKLTEESKIQFVGLQPGDEENDGEQKTDIRNIDHNGNLKYKQLEWSNCRSHRCSEGINISLPSLTPDLIPCQHAWILAITPYDFSTSSSDSWIMMEQNRYSGEIWCYTRTNYSKFTYNSLIDSKEPKTYINTNFNTHFTPTEFCWEVNKFKIPSWIYQFFKHRAVCWSGLLVEFY
jgi:Alpha-L-fucosidase C-terminal domain